MDTRDYDSEAISGAELQSWAPAAQHARQAPTLRALLESRQLELLPLKNIADAASHAPLGATLTVTCSPKKGLAATLDAAEMLAGRGFRVVPHLAARMVRDGAHLDEILSAAARMGLRDVFVPGGDAKHAAGPYTSSLELLRAMHERGHPFEEIGIATYPEGHWLLDEVSLFDELRRKHPFATYAVTQMCFSAESLLSHLNRLEHEGVHLPIYAGVAGAVDRAKLATIAMKIGIGQSLRFLKHQSGGVGRLLGTGHYEPTELIEETVARLDEFTHLRGLHIYTFNQVAKTEMWRRSLLASAE